MTQFRVLIILGCLTVAFQLLNAVSIYESKTFSVKSVVSAIRSKAGTKTIVEEAYSDWQRRASIIVKTSKDYGTNTTQRAKKIKYIADVKNKIIASIDYTRTVACEASNTKDFLESTNLEYIESIEGSESVDELIMGPMRLAFILNANIANLRLTTNVTTEVRNTPAYEYELYLKTKSGDQVKLEAYYQEKPLTKDSLPLVIYGRSMTGNEKDWIKIEYSLLKPLGLDTTLSAAHIAQPYGEELFNDRFMFEPLTGCDDVLEKYREKLFSDKSSGFTKFAFNAKVRHIGKSKNSSFGHLDAFVAYSGRIQTLRVDVLDTDKAKTCKRQIFNFGTNRLYHILDRSAIGDDEETNRVLDFHSQTESSPIDRHCVTAQIAPDEAHRDRTIAQLLTGSEYFVYLGRSIARGISALAYEISVSELPYWLEPSVTYGNKEKGPLMWRSPQERYFKPVMISLRTVLYLSMNDKVPLMMDIYGVYRESDNSTLRYYDQRRIHLYDFAWDLIEESPNGDKPTEMFSVKDDCSNGRLHEIELVLSEPRSKTDVDLKQLGSRRRDFALLGGIQENLQIPAPFIYDFESRIIESEDKKQKLFISLRFAEPIETVARLIHVAEKDTILGLIPVQSFHSCFMLAAHYSQDRYFGYEPRRKFCTISSTTIKYDENNSPSKPEDSGFMLSNKKYEVYRISHEKDQKYSSESNWLNKIDSSLRGLSLIMRESADSFVEIRVERAAQKLIQSSKNEDSLILHEVLKGYSFDESDPTSRRLDPSSSVDSKSVVTNFDHCRVACLLDANCHSYSVCVRGTETKCIVSDVSLTSDMMEQIKASTSGTVQTNDGVNVRIKKQFGCEIHPKHHTALFDDPMKFKMSMSALARYDIMPVDSLDRCADRCILETLNSASMRSARKSLTIEDVNLEQKQMMNENVCTHFYYIQLESLTELNDRTRDVFLHSVDENSTNKTVNGYCLFRDSKNTLANDSIRQDGTMIKVEVRVIKSRTFYQEQHGVRLKATQSAQVSEAEKVAWQRISMNLEPERNDLDLINSFNQRGDNWQLSIMPRSSLQDSGEECAKLCFLQDLPELPSCKSFDVSVEKRGDREFITCYFNSISLIEVEKKNRSDLIMHASGDVQTWHYEPITAFAINVADRKLVYNKPSISTSHSFGTFGVALLAILSGLFVGIVALERYPRARLSTPRVSIGSLNMLVSQQQESNTMRDA